MQNIDTETFINVIRSYPPIWCSTNAQYKNKNVLRKKWDEIVKLFPGSKGIYYWFTELIPKCTTILCL